MTTDPRPKDIQTTSKIVKEDVGKFVVQYEPDRPGHLVLSLLVDSEHIPGSPFRVEVGPAPAAITI